MTSDEARKAVDELVTRWPFLQEGKRHDPPGHGHHVSLQTPTRTTAVGYYLVEQHWFVIGWETPRPGNILIDLTFDDPDTAAAYVLLLGLAR